MNPNDVWEPNIEFNDNPIRSKGLAMGHCICNIVKFFHGEKGTRWYIS